MNKWIAICLFAGIGFTACNDNKAKEEALAKQEALQHVKDSLALDSFRRADAEKKAIAEESSKQAEEQASSNPNSANRQATSSSKKSNAGTTGTETTNDVYQDQGDAGYDGDTGYEQANEPVAQPSENTPVATAPKKKGWSDAAKGTAIGAGAGAVLGTIIGKGKGAAIGAAVGGAGGYAIGRKKDRQSGRVQKKD
ncbi:hypothetical protein GCM10023231_40020 [Olivibacter ginsenosidimutans]|uniref:YMGG-like Gly-zipper domain-containing protein n=1 Tax=Olivibacter ginsenosidimutans TaxID=1176537 RepID=A0ABP9C9S7_9SPHI